MPAIVGDSPRVDGLAYVGREVLCDRGDWNDREGMRYAVTYRWERRTEGWRPIAGADGESYVVTPDDVDRGLRCIVTAEGEWPVESYQTYGDWPPVETTLTALDDSVIPGADNGYRLTLTNPADQRHRAALRLHRPARRLHLHARRPRPARRRTTRTSAGLAATSSSLERGLSSPPSGDDRDRDRRAGQHGARRPLRLRRRADAQLQPVGLRHDRGAHRHRAAVRRDHLHDLRHAPATTS